MKKKFWLFAMPLVVALFGWLTPQVGYPASLGERFNYEVGYFEKIDGGWVEQRFDQKVATYIEEKRDAKFIYLLDVNRVHDGVMRRLHVRIPVSGGTAEFAWDSPTRWDTVLIQVRPRR
jgi:hypothetical protein